MMDEREGQVYLIRADNNLYKIGRTKDIKGRFKDFQTGCACAMELLWWIHTKDTYSLEKYLHRMFVSIRHHGEWFALTEQNVRFIEAIDDQTIEAMSDAKERELQQCIEPGQWGTFLG